MKCVITETLAAAISQILYHVGSEKAKQLADQLRALTTDGELTQHYQAGALNHNLLSEGTLEVDEDAGVSDGDDGGAYVMAWLWVDNEEMARAKLISEGISKPTQEQIDECLAKLGLLIED